MGTRDITDMAREMEYYQLLPWGRWQERKGLKLAIASAGNLACSSQNRLDVARDVAKPVDNISGRCASFDNQIIHMKTHESIIIHNF